MKIFIARGVADTVEDFGDFIAALKKRKNLKIYLIGENGHQWKEVEKHDLDGLVKTPPELKHVIEKTEH